MISKEEGPSVFLRGYHENWHIPSGPATRLNIQFCLEFSHPLRKLGSSTGEGTDSVHGLRSHSSLWTELVFEPPTITAAGRVGNHTPRVWVGLGWKAFVARILGGTSKKHCLW